MTEITLKIPDGQLAFFLEVFKKMGLEIPQDMEIPEEHKAIVHERIQLSKQAPGRVLNWDDVKDQFDL